MKTFREYLPSKQFAYVLMGALVFGALVVFLVFVVKPKTNVDQETLLVTSRNTLVEQDTDNDGVMDWEEILWRLDPHNPDTDSDGVLDGQEVALARQKIEEESLLVGEETRFISQTESLGQQIYLFASGNPMASQQEIAAFTQSAIESLSSATIVQYLGDDDFQIGNTNARNYYNNMYQAFIPINTINKPNDLATLEAFTMGDTSEQVLQDLEFLVVNYKKVSENLQGVAVPELLEDTHINIANSLLNMATAIEITFSMLEPDPVVALSAMSLYNIANDMFIENMQTVETYFVSNDIL